MKESNKYEEAIRVIKSIKSNHPTENYSMLKKALDLCLELLREKITEDY